MLPPFKFSDLKVSSVEESLRPFLYARFGEYPRLLQLCNRGVASLNYRARGTGYDMIIRCDLRRGFDAFLVDNYYQQLAAGAGVRVPNSAALLMATDRCVATYRQFIEGSLIIDFIPAPINFLHAAGDYLSCIHAVTGDTRRAPFYAFVWDRSDSRWNSTVESALVHPIAELRAIAAGLKNLILASELPLSPIFSQTGVVHGDLKFDNLLVTPEDRLVVLDWEKAAVGPVFLDLAIALFHTLCGDGRECRFSAAEALLQGYVQKTTLTDDAKRCLFSAIDLSASAFFLLDIGFASAAETIETELRQWRLRYFNEYCWPTYGLFQARRAVISEWCVHAVGQR